MLKNNLLLIILVISSFFILSFRLTDTPMGLTVDESAFGRNAALLSQTGHDENGIFLPIFVSSINHQDWRQPLTQYYQTLFFKIFGSSIYNLRLSTVILTVFSGVLLYYLISQLLSPVLGLIAYILFITTPAIFMHSHLGLDNMMPVPLTLLWLILLYLFSRAHRSRYVLLAGIVMGLAFYSYKGMRAVVPVWSILSCIYILSFYYQTPKKLFRLIPKIFPFFVGIAPFIAAFPILHHFYPGAIFGGARPNFSDIYSLIYPYLSHYDLTFLYIKGDDLLFHSTQIHGMVLLSTLPLFLIGLYQSIRRRGYWGFTSLVFFSGPLLYGLVDSVHRASRILAIVPSYIILCSLGFSTLLKIKVIPHLLFVLFASIILLNFSYFVKYYWYTYPKFTQNIFGTMTRSTDYQIFGQIAKNRHLQPYINRDIYEGFFDAINFPYSSPQIIGDSLPPPGSIYLTFHDSLPGLTSLNLNLPNFHIFTNP